ncbi:MAG: flagellar hook-basal body complex protein FliE [Acidobacteriota bacterium]
MAINPVASPTTGAVPVPALHSGSPAAFGDTLNRIMDRLESSNTTANDAIGRMLDGSGDVHEAMIALQRADLDLQLAVQVRNKLVQAYQDILRMPV